MIEVLDATSKQYKKRSKPPVLNLYPQMGRMMFSVEAVNVLGLKPADRIAFTYDTDDQDIIYFHRSESGLLLSDTPSVKKQTRLCAYSNPICRQLLAHMNYKSGRSFPITDKTVLFNERQCWFIQKLT